jgi:hypothetical protein
MARVLIHVEGQTEETFVNELLGPYLRGCGFEKVGARLLGNARQRHRRGGICGWNAARNDILRHLKGDAGCLMTTMVDYYGLPQTGQKAWPGRAAAAKVAFEMKAGAVEAGILNDVAKELGKKWDRRQFMPFVMMHEFEGLLFSDCTRFSEGIARPDLAAKFQEIREAFNSPEEINDSPITAPSKRVEALVPGYEKPLLGTRAARHIGLDGIRRECPHFRDWLERLESWPAA